MVNYAMIYNVRNYKVTVVLAEIKEILEYA